MRGVTRERARMRTASVIIYFVFWRSNSAPTNRIIKYTRNLHLNKLIQKIKYFFLRYFLLQIIHFCWFFFCYSYFFFCIFYTHVYITFRVLWARTLSLRKNTGVWKGYAQPLHSSLKLVNTYKVTKLKRAIFYNWANAGQLSLFLIIKRTSKIIWHIQTERYFQNKLKKWQTESTTTCLRNKSGRLWGRLEGRHNTLNFNATIHASLQTLCPSFYNLQLSDYPQIRLEVRWRTLQTAHYKLTVRCSFYTAAAFVRPKYLEELAMAPAEFVRLDCAKGMEVDEVPEELEHVDGVIRALSGNFSDQEALNLRFN